MYLLRSAPHGEDGARENGRAGEMQQENGVGVDVQRAHVGGDASQWKRAHLELTRLARARADQDFDEGGWLLTALRSGTHTRLGYGSFAEYVERLFGYAPRLTHDKLRVAEALENLPETAGLLRQGKTSWSALRELTRVATAETEREWLAVSQGCTVREVERLVSGHRPGNRPRDPVDSKAMRHVLRFDVSGEALAAFREAMTKIRREAGQHLDDDAALLLMARQVLRGPTDEGRASYQVALTICEQCQKGFIQGGGEAVPVDQDVTRMAACDGQHLGSMTRAARGEATHVGERGAVAEPERITPVRAAQQNPAGGATVRTAAGRPPLRHPWLPSCNVRGRAPH
jgi:hypothetical protein